MLIKLKAHTGIEYVNPEQITHVSVMKGYMLIHLVNQAMIPIDPTEWERVEDQIALPIGRLEERYTEALHTVYRQSQHIKDLETQLNPPPAADDQSNDDYGGF